MNEIEIVTFPPRGHLKGLAKFHKEGGELKSGMGVILERGYRAELKPAILLSWKIGSVKMDITGYGKYSESSCTVIENGVTKSWPFSMIYLKK